MTKKNLFDDAYNTPNLVFGNQPTRILAKYLDKNPLNSGTVLELGCGEGRDTIPLLKRGLHVTAIDNSPVGINKLWKRVESESISMDLLVTTVCDVLDFNWPIDYYDLVVAVTLLDHLEKKQTLKISRNIIDATKEGGIVFIEVHTDRDPAVTNDGPISEFSAAIEHYFGANELLDIFSRYLKVFVYEDRMEWDYDHGEPHKHGFASLLGVKKMRPQKGEKMKLLSMTPELIVKDVKQTIEFYEKNLGFVVSNKVPTEGEPVWAELRNGDLKFMVQKWDDTIIEMPKLSERRRGGITIFVFRLSTTTEVRQIAEKFANENDVPLPLRVTDYGTVEFGISDPDGYLLIFSSEE